MFNAARGLECSLRGDEAFREVMALLCRPCRRNAVGVLYGPVAGCNGDADSGVLLMAPDEKPRSPLVVQFDSPMMGSRDRRSSD